MPLRKPGGIIYLTVIYKFYHSIKFTIKQIDPDILIRTDHFSLCKCILYSFLQQDCDPLRMCVACDVSASEAIRVVELFGSDDLLSPEYYDKEADTLNVVGLWLYIMFGTGQIKRTITTSPPSPSPSPANTP